MQRQEDGGIVISCDFCGRDWHPYQPDPANPMIEGHRGSVLCLSCVKRALDEIAPAEGEYNCTLCVRENLPATLPRWRGDRPEATLCADCLNQAAGTFSKDPDVAWKRRGGG